MGRRAGVTAEETRRRLLDAAAAQFEARGYEGTRVADIAAGADLSNGALYGHFRSKTDLLSAALTDKGARELQSLFAGADGRSIADLLVAIGRSLDHLPGAPSGLMIEALVAGRRDPAVAEVAGRHLDDTESWLAGLIRDGQEVGRIDADLSAPALARFCVMLVLGAMLISGAERAALPGAGWRELIERLAGALSAPGT